jgi:hypothetical protein
MRAVWHDSQKRGIAARERQKTSVLVPWIGAPSYVVSKAILGFPSGALSPAPQFVDAEIR